MCCDPSHSRQDIFMKRFSPNAHYKKEFLKDFRFTGITLGMTALVSVLIFVALSAKGTVSSEAMPFWVLGTAVFFAAMYYGICFFMAAGRPSIEFFEDGTFSLKGKVYPLSSLDKINLSVFPNNSSKQFILYNTFYLEFIVGKAKSRVNLNFMSRKFIPDFKMMDDLISVLSVVKESSSDEALVRNVNAVVTVLNYFRLERESLSDETAPLKRFKQPFSYPEFKDPEYCSSYYVFEEYRKFLNS